MRACDKNESVRLDHRQKGIALVEISVVAALLAILTIMATPSYQEIAINRRLESKALEYVTHINWARSLAVSSNQAVNLHISKSENASCYVIFQGLVNDCSCNASGAVCSALGNARLVVVLLHTDGIKVSAKTESATTRINPKQGMMIPTLTAIFSADNGKAIHNISNILGRTRSCSPTMPDFGLQVC